VPAPPPLRSMVGVALATLISSMPTHSSPPTALVVMTRI